MFGTAAIDLLMARLGARTDQALRATVLAELNSTRMVLEDSPVTPWFLRQDNTSATTTANVEYVTVPTGFIRLDPEWGGVFYNDGSTYPDPWAPLVKQAYASMKEKFRQTAASSPQAFDILQDRIYIRPIPDAIYTLRVIGYFKDVDIVDDTTTASLWLTHAHDLLLAETGLRIAAANMQFAELAAAFAREAAQAKTRLLTAHYARMVDADSLSMGDD